MVIKKGDKVKIEYEGRFEDGKIFDSSINSGHSRPIEFIVGSGKMVPGFDKSVIGMKKGETKEFKIDKKEAYGEYNDGLKRKISRNILPKDQEPKKGMILVMEMPNGHQMSARIIEVNDEEITIDLNHPLAGKNLIFKIKVIEVNSK